MHAAADRPEFAPPPQPGMLRAVVLAVLAHLLLVVALTFGLHWQRETENVVAEAELWSQLPQQAAPKEAPAPPPPPPAPPVVRAPSLPDPQVQRDAQIALERERAKEEAEARRRAELQKQKELERKRKLEAQRKQQQREEELARRREEEVQEKKRLLAEARKREELEKEKKRRLEEQQARRLAQLREENMRRIAGLAGATGAPSATGNAQRSSGPSASWAGRVIARVKPNIVFTDTVSGNPEAVVTVRLAPDGTIIGKRLAKSSGIKAWDEAVLRALDKTETLPRDTDGRVPSGGDLVFRPRD